ncbi:MAG: sensor histidine kinase [Pseudomonadota bacterium]
MTKGAAMSASASGSQEEGRWEKTMARIDRFALRVSPVNSSTRCAEIYDRFWADEDLMAVPVVDEGLPVGLVYRAEFEHRLAHAYGRALYERKPIATLMDTEPLIVERGIAIEALQHVIASDRPSALLRGFIITDEGRYLALGTALSLLQASLARTEQRSRELERAYAAAESANRTKSSFLANMSHELRTPLNAIIGFAEIMRGEVLGPLPERYKGYAEDILSSGNHLLGMVNDLLDMAKIEAGRYELHEAWIRIGDALSAVARILRGSAERNGLTLVVESDAAAELRLQVDERAFRQMLLNLLSNAIKFTGPGGLVTASAVPVAGGALRVEVADSGIGMSPEHIRIALTPFGQVSVDLNRRHQGTGLGLPLVKSLMELHGGRLEIASELGEGTRVTLLFPARRVSRVAEAGAISAVG